MNHCQDRELNINLFAAQVLSKKESVELMRHLSQCPGCRHYSEEQIALCKDLFQEESMTPSKWSLEKRSSFKKILRSTERKKDPHFQEISFVPLCLKAVACLLVMTCLFGYFYPTAPNSKKNYQAVTITKSNNLLTLSNNIIQLPDTHPIFLNEEVHQQLPWPLLTPKVSNSI